jgi:glycosyltransferase involved in cell wall biosynthesis
MQLSIIVPCYNEAKNVNLIYDCIRKNFKNIKSYEIIFINDGSKDNTYKILKELSEKAKENIKVINFSRNFGKEAAMYAGLENSVGEYVSIIDADMQQDPKLVLDMIDYLDNNEEYDAVATYQEQRKEGKILTFFKSCFYKLMNKMSDTNFVQGASDFRTFRRSMVNSILSMKEYFRFSKGIFSWVGYNTYYMPYTVSERANGTSSWSFIKLFRYAVEGIVSFSTAPLKIATCVGITSSMLSVFYLIIVIIQKIFYGISVSGYATIVVLVLLLGGIQLFSLGIVGEYIARTYVETKKRPIYIAKNIINNKNK